MGNGTRVLVIEDDPDVGLLLVDILMADPNVVASLARHPSEVPADADPDVVLTDLFGSAWYDREIAAREMGGLRARFPTAPIVLVTAHWQAAQDQADLPVDAVMAKPFDVDALAQMVLSFAGAPRVLETASPTER